MCKNKWIFFGKFVINCQGSMIVIKYFSSSGIVFNVNFQLQHGMIHIKNMNFLWCPLNCSVYTASNVWDEYEVIL
jgi:hypothetical protein